MVAADPLCPDLGLAVAPEPLGTMVTGQPAHPGRSNSAAAYPASLVQPPALAADRPPLRAAAGLAGGATLLFLF